MRKHLLMSLAILTIFAYFYFNFVSTLSQNVIPVTAEGRDFISFFFPQGWGFFTKNPREAKYKLYKLDANQAPQLVNFKISSTRNLCGLSRKGNRISIELLRIQNQLPKTQTWHTSDFDIDQFDYHQAKFDSISLPKKDLVYIEPGKYIIKQYRITPWNWLKYPDNYSGEYKYYSFALN